MTSMENSTKMGYLILLEDRSGIGANVATKKRRNRSAEKQESVLIWKGIVKKFSLDLHCN